MEMEKTEDLYPQTLPLPITVSMNDFFKTGYNFTGWNTAADGSGTPYAEGDSYNVSSDETLYAQWSIASGVNVSVPTAFTACDGVVFSNFSSKWRLDAGNLDAITIAVIPTGYELSTDAMGGAYSSDIRDFAFPADIFGNVSSFNLYVRLAATANDGDIGDLTFNGILDGGAAAPDVLKNTGSATLTTVPAQPGTITASADPVCSGTSTDYTISAVSGATSYTWSFTGSGTPSEVVQLVPFHPPAQEISLLQQNSCGSSPQRTLSVTLSPTILHVDEQNGTDAAGYGASADQVLMLHLATQFLKYVRM